MKSKMISSEKKKVTKCQARMASLLEVLESLKVDVASAKNASLEGLFLRCGRDYNVHHYVIIHCFCVAARGKQDDPA